MYVGNQVLRFENKYKTSDLGGNLFKKRYRKL